MKIKSIKLENFCSHKKLSAIFGNVTHIKGSNEVGKSTIKRAIQFILNSRDENGKEISGIRPHDSEGTEIDKVETIAEITIDIDGTEYQLKKNYHQNFNKQGKFIGNSTDCYVSDILKKTKDYSEFIDEIVPNEMCLNAQSFLRLDTANRREVFENTFGTHTNDSVINEFNEFEPIRELLNVGTIEELKKRCRTALKGEKNKKGLYGLLLDIPTRIDEVERQKVDIDVAELELGRKAVKELLSSNQAKQEDATKQFEEYQKLSDGILELQFQLSDLQRKANEDLIEQRKEIENDMAAADNSAKYHSRTIILSNDCILNREKDLKRYEEEISKCRIEWSKINSLEFDENSLVCSYCGQEYPAEKKERLRAEFEQKKADDLKAITDEGNALNQRIKETKEEIEKKQKEADEAKKKMDIEEKELEKLEKQLSELPQSIDISDTDEYKEIQLQIAEKEKLIAQSNSIDEMRKQLKHEEAELRSQLSDFEREIAKAEVNVTLDERIEELHAEQKKLAQKIANQEKELDLIERFERKKAELLEIDVNNNFEYVKIKMFETQVNGELKNVCQVMVNGESYDRNLNHGNKILAEIDICRAFQKANNVCLPIIVDDCESLDEWRTPKVDNQLILIRRTDEELRIEVE